MSRWSIGLGLVGLLVALAVLVGTGLSTQADIVDHVYRIDPATGMLAFESRYDRQLAVAQAYEPLFERWVPATLAASIALSLIVLGAWRRGHLRIILPLVATLLIGLGAGLLFHHDFHDILVNIHVLLSDEPVDWGGDGLCTVWLEPCSRLVAGETIRALAFGGLALAVLALIPAARAVWRAGERGHRLGRGWSGAAWLCLACGAAALVATRGHRDDLERTLAACAQEGLLRPWNGRQTHFINVSSSELQARRVEVCEPGDWDEFLTAFGEDEMVAGAYQLFADGRISTLPMPDAWFDDTRPPFATSVLSDRELQSQLEESAFEATTPIMLLYVDQRSSRERRERVLALAREARVVGVILVGEAVIDGELAAVGAWQQRIYCPIDRLSL